MRLDNSYELQVENTLDPSHLHTVHDGFQGSRHKISPIECRLFYEDETVLTATFTHESDTPDMEITLLKPGTVVVKVLDKRSKELLRTNVVNVSPETDTTCNVLFRDIARYDGGVPADPAMYEWVNGFVIREIFKQDVAVTAKQQENVAAWRDRRYCMPAEADKLIVAFRRNAERYRSKG